MDAQNQKQPKLFANYHQNLSTFQTHKTKEKNIECTSK
jgi:hypothetical protein